MGRQSLLGAKGRLAWLCMGADGRDSSDAYDGERLEVH